MTHLKCFFALSYSFFFSPRSAWVASIQSSSLVAVHTLISRHWNDTVRLPRLQRLPKCCRSSEEEAWLAKRSQGQRPAEKHEIMLHVNGAWRRHSPAFAHLLNVKGEPSSESLKCKGWDGYTSLPWEKAHLSWVSDLHAPGCQVSNTLSMKRRERSRRLCREPLVQRRGQRKACRFPYFSLYQTDRVFQAIYQGHSPAVYSHHHPWEHSWKQPESAATKGCSLVAPRVWMCGNYTTGESKIAQLEAQDINSSQRKSYPAVRPVRGGSGCL